MTSERARGRKCELVLRIQPVTLSNLYVYKIPVVLQLVPCNRIISGLQKAVLHFGLPTVVFKV